MALGLMADVRTFLHQVLAGLDRRADLNKCVDARQKWLKSIDGYRKEWDKFVVSGFSDDTTPINPQRAALEIDKILPEDAIPVSDIGVHHNRLLSFCKPKRPDSFPTSPPWRARAASKACASIAPAIWPRPFAQASPPTGPLSSTSTSPPISIPSGAGVWELPGLGQSKPGIGTRYQPA